MVGDQGKSLGIVSRDQALFLAYQYGLDIVELSPGATPPVYKLIDYDKYRYQLEKQAKLAKQRSKASELKEIKLSYKIDEHDFNFKAKRAKEFLADGDKIKAFIRLVGRENIFSERARDVMHRFRDAVEGEYESQPNLMGNRLIAIIKSKKQ